MRSGVTILQAVCKLDGRFVFVYIYHVVAFCWQVLLLRVISDDLSFSLPVLANKKIQQVFMLKSFSKTERFGLLNWFPSSVVEWNVDEKQTCTSLWTQTAPKRVDWNAVSDKFGFVYGLRILLSYSPKSVEQRPRCSETVGLSERQTLVNLVRLNFFFRKNPVSIPVQNTIQCFVLANYNIFALFYRHAPSKNAIRTAPSTSLTGVTFDCTVAVAVAGDGTSPLTTTSAHQSQLTASCIRKIRTIWIYTDTET